MAETLEIGANELFKGEIDTSAPFESVKEAVTMFGGLGFYKPLSSSSLTKPSPNSHLSCNAEGVDIGKEEEQIAELEAELILNELEATKVMVEELKSKLQSEEVISVMKISANKPSLTKEEVEEKENDDANMSEENVIKQVEEVMEEVETSKRVLEDVLERAEAANNAKLAVEEALRKWRIESGERKRSTMLDLNGVNLLGGDPNAPILKPALSIGQILSRKLLITKEFESGKSCVKRKVSLSQMLGKQNGKLPSAWKSDKSGKSNPEKLPVKRKFGFTRFSVLLPRQSQKKKKSSLSSRFNFLSSGCKGELQEIDQLAFLKI